MDKSIKYYLPRFASWSGGGGRGNEIPSKSLVFWATRRKFGKKFPFIFFNIVDQSLKEMLYTIIVISQFIWFYFILKIIVIIMF